MELKKYSLIKMLIAYRRTGEVEEKGNATRIYLLIEFCRVFESLLRGFYYGFTIVIKRNFDFAKEEEKLFCLYFSFYVYGRFSREKKIQTSRVILFPSCKCFPLNVSIFCQFCFYFITMIFMQFEKLCDLVQNYISIFKNSIYF